MKKEVNLNINTNVDTEPIKQAKNEIEAFRRECANNSIQLKIDQKSLKVDTKGFFKAITSAKALEDQLRSVQKTAPKMIEALEKADTGFGYAEKFREELKDVSATFSDGSIIKGFDNITSKISEGFSLLAVDLGGRAQYIKDQIESALNEISSFDGSKNGIWGKPDLKSGNMDINQLERRIKLVKELFEYQDELEYLNGRRFKAANSPLGVSTDNMSSYTDSLQRTLETLKRYNLQTTEQLNKRNELIRKVQSTSWDSDIQKDAINNIKDDDKYNKAIESLKSYIENRKQLIAELQHNENELFSYDGVSTYVEQAYDKINAMQSCMDELQQLKLKQNGDKDGPIVGDFSKVIDSLNEVKEAINEIRDAFAPLTDAFANEESAMSKMIQASVSDLETLQAKYQEVFNNIQTLSQKEFNIVNNTFESNKGGKSEFLILRDEANELRRQIDLLTNDAVKIANAFNKSGINKSRIFDIGQTIQQAAMLTSSKSAFKKSEIENTIGFLRQYKQELIEFNNLINDTDLGKWKYDYDKPIVAQMPDEPQKAKVDVGSFNADSVINELKTLEEQSSEIFNNIKANFNSIFDFDTIAPNYGNIQSIIDTVYQQFVDLQNKINSLEFKLELPEISANKAESDIINSASDAIKNEGNAAQIAAAKKNAFADANKQVAASALHTATASQAAADGIKSEADEAESAVGSLNNIDGMLVGINDVADKYNRSKKKWDENRRSTLESRSKSIAESVNEYIRAAGIKASSIDTTILDREYKDSDGTPFSEEIAKFVVEGTDMLGKTVKITQEYNIARGTLEKASTKYHDAVNQFNLETAKSTAASQVKELQSQMGSFKIDLSDLTRAQNGIVDEDSFDVFTEKLSNAKQRLSELKSMLKSSKSLDPIVNSENMMSNLDTTVKTYRENIKKFSDVKGFKELEGSLDTINNKLKEFNDAKTEGNGNAMANAVAEINKEIAKYNSNLKLVQARYQENNRAAKEAAETDKKRIVEEKAMWDEHNDKKANAAEIERQTQLAYSIKAAQDAKEAEEQLKWEREEAEARQKLDLDVDKQVSALDKQIEQWRAKGQLTDDLRIKISQMRDSLYDVTHSSELSSWNKQWTILKNEVMEAKYATDAANQAQKQDAEAVNKLLQKRKEVYDNILQLKKQMDDADGDKEREVISKELKNQTTLSNVLTRQLATYKDINLQRKVTEQDNKFREQNDWYKSQKQIKAAADFDKSELESQKQNYKDILYIVEQLYDAQTALHKMNIDSSGNVHDADREKEIARVKEWASLLKEIYGIDIKYLYGSLNRSDLLTQEQKNKLLEREREYKQDIVDLTARAADKAATMQKKEQERANKKNQNYGKSEYDSATKFLKKMDANMALIGKDNASQNLKNLVNQYKEAYSKIAGLREQFENDASKSKDVGLTSQFDQSIQDADKLSKKIQEIFSETQKMENAMSVSGIGTPLPLEEFDLGNLQSSMIAYVNSLQQGEFAMTRFDVATNTMYGTLRQGDGIVQNVAVALNSGTNQLYAYATAVNKVSSEWDKFKSEVAGGAKQVLGMYFGFHEAMQALKTGFNSVKDIDIAMTELKKVTDATDESYTKFLKDAASTSSAIGSTISDFTEATSTFARLGYSIEESADMAEAAIIYKNVADGLDSVEDASQSIISTMAAFGIESNDVMSIVDKFNEVGNNFAITSAGIGEALQRSASALYSAGNTIDESIALVTAAM